jgi:hypothetical protein
MSGGFISVSLRALQTRRSLLGGYGGLRGLYLLLRKDQCHYGNHRNDSQQ